MTLMNNMQSVTTASTENLPVNTVISMTPDELIQIIVSVMERPGTVKEWMNPLYHFIAKWPEYAGGWLLWHCGILKKEISLTQAMSAHLYIEIDFQLSIMSIYVKGISPLELPGFNDYFIRHEQFIHFVFT